MAKKFLQFILKLAAKLVLWRHRPVVVAITGSVGKTSTKEAIYEVLRKKFLVGKSRGNYNNELGLPLAVLGAESGRRSVLLWLMVFIKFFFRLFSRRYPQILVLEMGADRPGDIDYLTKIARPTISVVTRVGRVHLEFFESPEDLQKEKSRIVSALPQEGTAVLNADDPKVLAMRHATAGTVLTYGLGAEAEVRAEDILIFYETKAEQLNPETDIGTRFIINFKGKKRLLTRHGILGTPAVYAALAAFCVGKSLGMTAEEIISGLKKFRTPPGRLRLLLGIKKSLILDDSYNSSPEAAVEAVRVLRQIRARRRIAVLGDMLELGPETESAHRQIGRLVKDLGIDLLFTVGPKAKFIAEEARRCGFAKTKIFEFNSSQTAALPLQNKIREGDVVLVKGSQGVRMEKIVLEVMAEPERAPELLCRQGREWQKR